jgi:hypothetical protein
MKTIGLALISTATALVVADAADPVAAAKPTKRQRLVSPSSRRRRVFAERTGRRSSFLSALGFLVEAGGWGAAWVSLVGANAGLVIDAAMRWLNEVVSVNGMWLAQQLIVLFSCEAEVTAKQRTSVSSSPYCSDHRCHHCPTPLACIRRMLLLIAYFEVLADGQPRGNLH